MIASFTIEGGRLRAAPGNQPALDRAVWVDLFEPTEEEQRAAGDALSIDVPSREDMEEIEASSRLYASETAVFMTAGIAGNGDDDDPDVCPVTFALAGPRLLTIRYHEPRALKAVQARAERSGVPCASAAEALVILLEAVVDRAADTLERAGRDVDAISRDVFQHRDGRPADSQDYQATLGVIGRKGDLVSDIRESCAALERLSNYLTSVLQGREDGKALRGRAKTLTRDVRSLIEHAGFLESKVAFLLDATLGLISIDQNRVMKILSIAAAVFLPPTLIASFFGMNFEGMRLLETSFGYPLAVGLMVVTAVVPLIFFKSRGWF